MKNHGSSAADRIGATSRKWACRIDTASEQPNTNPASAATSSGSTSSSGPSDPRIATQTGISARNSTPKITSCTVTTAAGIVSRGKRTLRTSEDWSISDAALAISDCEKKTQIVIPISRNSG